MNVEALTKLEAAIVTGDIADVNRVLGKIFAADHSLPWERVSNVNSACCGSLDAAKALHDAVLPGWAFEFHFWPGPKMRCDAILRQTHEGQHGSERWHGGKDKRIDADGETPARAWLLAIIRALIAQAGKGGQE